MNKLFLKDARGLTDILSPEKPCVDTVITSPPYWNLKDYGGVIGQIGYGQQKDTYLSDVEKVLENCFLVTKSTGTLWLIVDDYSAQGVLQFLPWEIAERARKVGWIARDLIIWDKQHSLPWQTNGRMRNVSEFIIVMSKTETYKYYVDRIKTLDGLSRWWIDFPERFNPKGKTPTNIWSIPFRTKGTWRKPSKIDHHCSFPTALVARIIELTTDPGDLVMDPFAGSSVVLAQAAAMRRKFVGFEINTKYVDMFEETVKNEVAEEWKEIQQLRKTYAKVEHNFEATVLKLRALKFTRMVTRPFLDVVKKDASQNTIKAIICLAEIPAKYQRKTPINISIYISVENTSDNFVAAQKTALERAITPPLSQYEISATIKVIKHTSLVRNKNLTSLKLHLYPGYKTRSNIGSDFLSEWLKGDRLTKLYPATQPKIPLFANIDVDLSWAHE